ncbi:MAG: hypothetical protein COA50_02730 [Flavobacteriaceae bacterium]|nr:MAG: hypothetical protein COA50_02730 [Flavobacteriaceae bacterium]
MKKKILGFGFMFIVGCGLSFSQVNANKPIPIIRKESKIETQNWETLKLLIDTAQFNGWKLISIYKLNGKNKVVFKKKNTIWIFGPKKNFIIWTNHNAYLGQFASSIANI